MVGGRVDGSKLSEEATKSSVYGSASSVAKLQPRVSVAPPTVSVADARYVAPDSSGATGMIMPPVGRYGPSLSTVLSTVAIRSCAFSIRLR